MHPGPKINLPPVLNKIRYRIRHDAFYRSRIVEALQANNRISKLQDRVVEKVLSLLECLVRHISLEHRGELVVCHQKAHDCTPMMEREISQASGLRPGTCNDYLAELRELGWLHTQEQYKKMVNGELAVTASVRVLTPAFFDLLGLRDAVFDAINKAVERAKKLGEQWRQRVPKFILKERVKHLRDLFRRKPPDKGPEQLSLLPTPPAEPSPHQAVYDRQNGWIRAKARCSKLDASPFGACLSCNNRKFDDCPHALSMCRAMASVGPKK